MKARNATKPEGAWDVRRKITIPALTDESAVCAVDQTLNAIKGMCGIAVDIERQQIVVCYDSSRLAYSTIVDELKKAGFTPKDNWWSRIRAKYFQFTDMNARDNARAPMPTCCNKPPK